MTIISKKIREILKLILLLDQMDIPEIMLFARDANTLLENQDSARVFEQSKLR